MVMDGESASAAKFTVTSLRSPPFNVFERNRMFFGAPGLLPYTFSWKSRNFGTALVKPHFGAGDTLARFSDKRIGKLIRADFALVVVVARRKRLAGQHRRDAEQ